MHLEILLVLWAILLVFIIKMKNYRNYWKKRGIVQVNGNAWHFTLGKCSLSEVYKNIYDSYPSLNYVGTFVGNKPVLILKNLEDIQAVLQGDFQSFYGRGYNTNPKDVLADNLLLIDDYSRWRLVRQKLTPVFTGLKLKTMFDTVERCAADFVEYIKEYKPAKQTLFEALHTYTSVSISASIFGINSQSQNTMVCPTLDSCGSSVLFNIKFALSIFFPKLFSFLNLKTFGDHRKFVFKVAKQIFANRRKINEKRHDFIDICIELQKQGVMFDPLTGYKIKTTDEILAVQAFSFFLAGVDTVANSINFTLLELSKNHVILKRLHKEIDNVFDKCRQRVTYEEIRKMEYLDMVVNESLRKYPPIGLMQRMCMRDTVLPSGNLKIDKNTIVIVPIYALHRDESYYPTPEIFDPDRFSSDNATKIVKLSYMPFGEGNRICLGSRFAHLQIKTVLAWLLRSYSLKGYNYMPKCFEPDFFGIRDPKARYDLISRSDHF